MMLLFQNTCGTTRYLDDRQPQRTASAWESFAGLYWGYGSGQYMSVSETTCEGHMGRFGGCSQATEEPNFRGIGKPGKTA